jgi:hypothetical protein
MYFVLPLWLAAGFADYLCHRTAHIESNSGWTESLLHLLQFAELAVPVLAALFFEINTSIILIMIVCLVLHELTAIWDVSYATATREVTPTEQHVHSVLEMLPLMGAPDRRRDLLGPVHLAVWPGPGPFRAAAQDGGAEPVVYRHNTVRDAAVRSPSVS